MPELARVRDPFALDLQDCDLVDQLPRGDLDGYGQKRRTLRLRAVLRPGNSLRRGSCLQMLGQGVADLFEDLVPLAAPLLAEESHRGVPGAVRTLLKPAPVARNRQRDPHRHAEGPGEVSN